MRDQYNLSGDFRGAVVSINSSLNNAKQVVLAHGVGGDVDTARLDSLLNRLTGQLAALPISDLEEAEALAVSTKQMVEAAAADRPNRSLVAASIRSVLTAAKNLIARMPTIASTVNDIVEIIEKVNDLTNST